MEKQIEAKKGLSSTALKVIGLVLMTIDHIGYFFPGMPIILRIIGRTAAPLFFFACAEGMRHSSNRLRYLLRLYAFSVVMQFGKVACVHLFHVSAYSPNIFGTLFYAALFMFFLGNIMEARESGDVKKAVLNFALVLLPIIWVFVLPIIQPAIASLGAFGDVILALLPQSLTAVEGGLLWVLMGVGFYLLPGKAGAILMLALVAGGELVSAVGVQASLRHIFTVDFQWLKLLAIPFIALYNNQKGKGLKWLFYTYYPAHMWLFYALRLLLFTQ